jgi:hypothetical protein
MLTGLLRAAAVLAAAAAAEAVVVLVTGKADLALALAFTLALPFGTSYFLRPTFWEARTPSPGVPKLISEKSETDL